MRTAPVIQEIWDRGGPFIGSDKPCSRVTVEPDWYLNATPGKTWGTSKRGRYRWFQHADLSQQNETELPNIKSVQITRSIDQDAATAVVILYNQWMNLNGVDGYAGQLGQPGYFTFNRGQSPDSQSRWNQETNDWENILIPNALLRTYQGFGGHDVTIPEALTAGNLILTGCWLIDTVEVGTDGTLTVSCRDMAKLLIEQQLWPPLIPRRFYPLRYCRYRYETKTISNREQFRTIKANRRATYGDCGGPSAHSGSDVWYGTNAAVHGHRPSDAFDDNHDSYWLSVGNSQPSKPYAVEWIEM